MLGQLIHDAGGRTCTAITLPAYKAIGDAIDTPILGLGLDARKYLQALRDGEVARPEHPILCYWQFWEECPLANRYLFGYLLWASGLDGAIPYGYQHFGGSGDPYEDLDAPGKDMFVAYPGKNGPVATVQWEACREGINDLRYLQTLEGSLARARERLGNTRPGSEKRVLREKIDQAHGFLDDLRHRIQLVPSDPVMPPPDAQEYIQLRESVITHISALNE
jgi:hypothetical protein